MAMMVHGQRLLRAEQKEAVDVCRRVFKAAKLGKVDVQVTFVIDAEIRALNRHWRRKDKATDVLSFSAWEGEQILGDDRFLGDLIISVETAAKQARACGHDILTEVGVLVCHGLCHLAGLDHERGIAEADRQLSVEMGMLDAAGLPVTAALSGRG